VEAVFDGIFSKSVVCQLFYFPVSTL